MISCASLHLLLTLTMSGEQTLPVIDQLLSSPLEQDDDLWLIRSTIFDWEYRGPMIRAPIGPPLHILPPKEVAQPSRRRHDAALLPPANSQELIAQHFSPSSSGEPLSAEPEIRQKYHPLVRHQKPAPTFLLPVASGAGRRS